VRDALKSDISGVDDFAKKYKTETNAYLDSLLYLKSVATNAPSEESGILQVYKNFILEERKPEQMGD